MHVYIDLVNYYNMHKELSKKELEQYYKKYPTWKSVAYYEYSFDILDIEDSNYIRAIKYSLIINSNYNFVRQIHRELNIKTYEEIVKNIKKENLC